MQTTINDLPWELRAAILDLVPIIYLPYVKQVCRDWNDLSKKVRSDAMATLRLLIRANNINLLLRLIRIPEESVRKYVIDFNVGVDTCGIFIGRTIAGDERDLLSLALSSGHVHMVKWILKHTTFTMFQENEYYLMAIYSPNPIELLEFLYSEGYKYIFDMLCGFIDDLSNIQLVVDWFESKSEFHKYYNEKNAFNFDGFWYDSTLTNVQHLVQRGLFNILRALNSSYITPSLLEYAKETITDVDLRLFIGRTSHFYKAVTINTDEKVRYRIITEFGWNPVDPLADMLAELKTLDEKSIEYDSLVDAIGSVLSNYHDGSRISDKDYKYLIDLNIDDDLINEHLNEQREIRENGEATDEDARIAKKQRDRLEERMQLFTIKNTGELFNYV